VNGVNGGNGRNGQAPFNQMNHQFMRYPPPQSQNPNGNAFNGGYQRSPRPYQSQNAVNGPHSHSQSQSPHQQHRQNQHEHQPSLPGPNGSGNNQMPYIIKTNKKNKPRTMTYNGPSHPVSNGAFNHNLDGHHQTGNYPSNGISGSDQHKVSVAENAAQIAMSYMDGQRVQQQHGHKAPPPPHSQSMRLNVNGGRRYEDEMEEVERSEEKKAMDLHSASRHDSNPQIVDHHHLGHSSFGVTTVTSTNPSGHEVNVSAVSRSAVSQDTVLYHGTNVNGGGQGGLHEVNQQLRAMPSQHSHSHSHSNSRSRSRPQSVHRHPPAPPPRSKNSSNGSNRSGAGTGSMNPAIYSAQISVISPSVEKEEADFEDEEHPELPRKYGHRGGGGQSGSGRGLGSNRDGFEHGDGSGSMNVNGLNGLKGSNGMNGINGMNGLKSLHQKEEDDDGDDGDDGNGPILMDGDGDGDGDHDGDEAHRENRAISVMTDIPQIQHETIYLQLTRFTEKGDLRDELYSVIKRLRAEIKAHQTRIASFKTTQQKLESKHRRQQEQWRKWYIVELQYLGNEYFGALFEFLSTQMSIEWTYIECFNEKLKRLTAAHNTVLEHENQWDMATLQDFVKETIVGVTRMKVSSATITRKRALEQHKAQIGSLQREYEEAKRLLATKEVDAALRQQAVAAFFGNVTSEYSERTNNLLLTTTFFCDELQQDKFNSFILDERCQVHRQMVKQWLIAIAKQAERQKVTIKAVYHFLESLIIKFNKMYSVDKISASYYYYVERFTYICILSIPVVDHALSALLQTAKGQREHEKLAQKHQYQLFCKLLAAKYMANGPQSQAADASNAAAAPHKTAYHR